jgi:LAS superfamily LD-carboxypeptidase LdcB
MGVGTETRRRRRRALRGVGGQSGQALILALGGAFVLLAATLALVAIAGAVAGKGRVQRAADLAAISAARSMRDDLPRLLSPPTLANGLPNPAHLDKLAYLARARTAAVEAGKANGVDPSRLQLSFPDSSSFAPVRAEASVRARLEVGAKQSEVEASATAEAAAPIGAASASAMAAGGGYSGPLVYRGGEGMRPDVAVAYDQMAAAARGAGISLLVVSGFRSDAEQAALFAAHPDPTWVAPPGHSLHRCGTELDLGPESAYAWLAANAGRFGFVQRYSWEAWHYGFDAGPPPCSEAGNSPAGGGGVATATGAAAMPSFVPSRFRAPLVDAATHWNVSAALLAAQLMAESNFNLFAVSPAGAQGIAQFMSQAYVTRILALLGGAGAPALPGFEVRLVA